LLNLRYSLGKNEGAAHYKQNDYRAEFEDIPSLNTFITTRIWKYISKTICNKNL